MPFKLNQKENRMAVFFWWTDLTENRAVGKENLWICGQRSLRFALTTNPQIQQQQK